MVAATRRRRWSTKGSRIVRLRTLRRICGAVIASTVMALTFIPGVASAHAILESSSPEPSALLASSPKEIRLDFDEQVEDTLGDVRVYDSEQREVSNSKTVRSSTDINSHYRSPHSAQWRLRCCVARGQRRRTSGYWRVPI